MLLVAGDAPPVPTTNVDGNLLIPTTSLAASPPAKGCDHHHNHLGECSGGSTIT